jgi:hypothetical protein
MAFNAIIASFLGKLQQNIAQSRDFSFHTTKHVTLRPHRINSYLCVVAIGWCARWDFENYL